MNLLIFSDSHGDDAILPLIAEKERPDACIHLGDHDTDAALLHDCFPGMPLFCVRGNNDFGGNTPEELVEWIGGRRIWMTHGHRYRVKSGTSLLLAAAREAGADIALFGHTHRPCLRYQNGLWLLNPGSACRYFKGAAAYAVIRIEKADIRCDMREMGGLP